FSFMEIWLEGDDANYDGVVDEQDQAFYGEYMTDQDGSYIYREWVLTYIENLEKGEVLDITIGVIDSEGYISNLNIIIEIK
ncbi:MAG TPA: VCBS domain-containing protein, partial [Candidatus Izemoplasmatales bacterium]|nr:VCBS domain-containing protein [Candidatus Izemoplasmatales bacterium]